MEEKEKGSKGGSGQRWKGAIANLTEMTSNLDSLQKLLLKKAVFVDEETFSKASLTSEQARSIKVLDSWSGIFFFHAILIGLLLNYDSWRWFLLFDMIIDQFHNLGFVKVVFF